jgi:RHS repeat-associated protein
MWLAASSFAVPDGVLATLTTAQLSGKPHQGVQSRNPASHPGIGECNSTAAIGLRASLALNGLRQSERARYYGSALGRFTSPDPAFESEILELPQTWNRYTYVYNRPLSITDPDGRCPPCVGAIIGGVVEGGWNLGSQLYQNGGDLGQVSWSEVGANAAGGAVTGAIAGATAGGSLLADALIGAGANVAGGIVTRTVKGDDPSDIVAPRDVATDAVAGLVGGGAGHLAADLVHVPEEPGSLGMRRHAVGRRKLAKYDAAAAARKSAIGVQVGIGAAAGSPPFHGTASFINNFWGVVDWLIFTPENREPKACVSVSDSASGSHFGGCGN